MKTLLFLLTTFLYTCVQAQQSTILIDRKTQKRTIDTMAARLNNIYFYEKMGKAMADKIMQGYKSGAYKSLTDASAFALKLTDDLLSISHDKHIGVRLEPGEGGNEMPSVKGDDLKFYETIASEYRRNNFGFTKVEILGGNVAYINFAFFAHPHYADPVVEAAMQFVANSDALIIDFRNNGGGHPGPGELLLSYLFKDSILISNIWWRYINKTIENYTRPSMSKYFYDKPVYILMQHKTRSAPEGFAYAIQALKRGIVVGEVSAGAANPGFDIRVNEYFTMFVPNGHVTVIKTGSNWEGTGVIPDVPASKADALKVAHRLAIKQMIEIEKDIERKKELEEIVEKIN